MLAWMLAWCSGASALNPGLDISQYAHTAWKIRDGFAKGTILSVAQTPDGYLWLGTELGMLRFDGVRPVPWQPPPGQSLPSSTIRALLATRDGALWIGTDAGLARWKDRTLTRQELFAGRFVANLLEDHEGSIWATTFFNGKWTLCQIRPTDAECYGNNGGPGAGAISVYEDRTGQLWVGTVGPGNGVWRWKPNSPKFYILPQQANGIRGLAEDADGALVSLDSGVYRFIDGGTVLAYRFPASTREAQFSTLLHDRDGGLWLGSSTGGGLVHFHGGLTDAFASSDGLSGDAVYKLFQDREGDIWVATTEGLDRFRDITVATYSVKQGLTTAQVDSILAARDGSIWMSSVRLIRWSHGQVTSPLQPTSVDAAKSIFQDSLGRVWVSTPNEIGYLEGNRLVTLKGVGGSPSRWIAEDVDANLWIANVNLGLFRTSIRTGGSDLTRWDKLNRGSSAVAMAADRSLKGVWLGFRPDGLVYFADGQVRASYGTADGIGEGIRTLQLDRDGTLWVATEGGLSRVRDGRVVTLTTKNGLPCDGVEWVVEDEDRALWLGTRCGLVRIARADIVAWVDSAHTELDANLIKTAVFDNADGVRTYIGGSYYSQPAVKGSDGRVWFVSPSGVSVVDPRALPFNKLPPPVRIEQIVADGTTYDPDLSSREGRRLPPLTRDLEIDYTALSLVAPEKMRFRYKLDGHDADWQDVGTRRQAFYADLPPGNYRFHVIASNNSGVWNETGATLDFAVASAYYQTAWFRALVAVGFFSLLLAAYRFRLRQLARIYNTRLDARVAERTRIARDLHDTLLQSFQGVLLKFHAATYLLPERPEDARQTLERVIDQARSAITEGRDAIQGLRASVLTTNDLGEAITLFGDALAAEQPGGQAPQLSVHVEGTPRDLAPIVQDDIYRIVCEGLRNAFRHAAAKNIEMEIHYDTRQLRVRIRDDGKGIEAHVIEHGSRPGHHGMQGMHERAHLVGGALTIWSEVDSGTEVELTVPASAAYVKTAASRPSSAPGLGT